MRRQCLICADLARDDGNSGIATLYSAATLRDAVLFEGRSFALLAGPGALSVGYVLLVPKAHVECFVDLSADKLCLVQRLHDKLAAFLRTATGADVVIFEHGRTRSAPPHSGCVNHAHLHFLPIPDAGAIKRRIRDLFPDSATLELYQLAGIHPGGDYLVVSDGVEINVHKAFKIESQLVRRIAADALELSSQWNWQFFSHEGMFRQTIMLFQSQGAQLVADLADIDR